MKNQVAKFSRCGLALMLGVSATLVVVALSGCGSADSTKPPAAESPRSFEVALKPDIPEGYKDRVGKFQKPLRQDVTTLRLVRRDDGAFDIEFPATADVPPVKAVDFRPFLPRVPKLAEGNGELTKIALIQRELNRNQTRYDMPGFGSAWIANNCLKKGLWEIGLDKKDEQGNWVTTCHAWFEFPKDEYERLFDEVNTGKDPNVRPHADYPELNGLPVAMDALRSVKNEVALAKIDTNLDKAIEALPEQTRKLKLIVAPQAKTYADWVAPANQPVTTAKFSEPGFYINADPVKFDLTWLAKPATAELRDAKSASANTDLEEIEIKFENGNRLVLASSELAKLPARSEPPKTEKDVLKVTFGIGTPEIYADAPERLAEFQHPANNYLLLLDAAGKHVDNHKAGIDRVFAWRDAKDNLHLYLVGYERIMFVGHLTMPLPAGQHAAMDAGATKVATR
ncbi:MAG: hypothetical protein QOF78_866 [Phycisphaerales bacterium]|jgi:hypothetical protein|nr:hypothetical protein [Phycisphaerales bacterium]